MTMKPILACGLLLVAASLFIAWDEQPLSHASSPPYWKALHFSHAFHVKEQGIACEDCHPGAKTSGRSSDKLVGGHEICSTCHEQQVSSACGVCHTDTLHIAAVPKPGQELVFSHERHTAKDSIACRTCHTEMEEIGYATGSHLPAMAACINCHRERNVSTECETCHRDFAGLIPRDHLAGDFRKDHKRRTRLAGGSLDASCSTCHTESFCQECHAGIELKGFGSTRDLMADPSPRTPLRDTPAELRLQQVHDLNYRFTHGVDVRSKRVDCASCHEQSTFCSGCHEAGGNITQEKIRPATHDRPGFTTLGRGSGGGVHAELARRDIESCIACHDVEGADPVCTLCHAEGGKVR